MSATSEHSRRYRVRHFFQSEQGFNNNSFLMERMHMTHLIKKFGEAQDVGGLASMISLPEVNHIALKNSMLGKDQAWNLQQVFDRFRERQVYSHAFLIGLSNHWAALLANKTTEVIDGKPKATIEMFYLDSRNDPVVTKDHEFFSNLVKAYYDKKEKNGVVAHRKWREMIYIQSLKDSEWIIHMLHQGIHGKIHFLTFYVDLIVEGSIEKFDSFVTFPYQEDPTKDLFMLLLSYLESMHSCLYLLSF